MSGKSEKFTGILRMVQLNPVPVFGIKKKYQYHWTKIFTEISVQMVSAQSGCVGRLGTEEKKEIIARLRVVLYFPSRIVRRAREMRARVKITHREEGAFLARGDFHARLRFARSTIPEGK